MSTAPRSEPRYSVADDLQWEGDWELWNGVAVAMSPSPLGPHERAAAKLVFQIESCLQAQGCACATYARLDWIVSDDTVVRPDVMVVCGTQPRRDRKGRTRVPHARRRLPDRDVDRRITFA